jgi:hypothetical protein
VDSRLLFAEDVDFHEATAAAGASWRFSRDFTLSASVGILTDGWARPLGEPLQKLNPGPTVAVGLSYVLLDGTNGMPFSTVSVVAAGLTTRSTDASSTSASFSALDFRLSGIIGYTFWHRVSPYVGVVVFGGPVWWSVEPGVAGDAYHYQVLLGGSFALAFGFDIFVEGSPLGERSLSGGLGYRF